MTDRLNKITSFIQLYIIDNKAWGGLFFILIGILFLIGAIKDWNWIFGNVSPTTYNLRKLDGIINMFGRKTGRVFAGIGGVLIIICGIVWLYACVYITLLNQ